MGSGDGGTSPKPQSADYDQRMRLIQRWRRIAILVCVLLAVDALVTLARDPASANPASFAVIESLFVFIVAILVAVNFFTFRLRK